MPQLGNSLMIIEDFGDNSFNNISSNNNKLEEELYKNAIDNLVKLHKITPPAFLVDHSNKILLECIEIFYHYVQNSSNQEQYLTLWQRLLSNLSNKQKVIVLRDFHADNLFWLAAREGSQKTGIIDFQDASIGNPAYDLASLLEDARH
mgnify:CR=1 FL=1